MGTSLTPGGGACEASARLLHGDRHFEQRVPHLKWGDRRQNRRINLPAMGRARHLRRAARADAGVRRSAARAGQFQRPPRYLGHRQYRGPYGSGAWGVQEQIVELDGRTNPLTAIHPLLLDLLRVGGKRSELVRRYQSGWQIMPVVRAAPFFHQDA